MKYKYDYSMMGKKSSLLRWVKIHSKVRINKELSKEKISIMAYLSGDGYIKVREKGFHYEIAFYMDDLSVAKRIVELFRKEYGVEPKIKHVETTISKGKGYYRVVIKNKPVCLDLLSLGKYGKLEWSIPSGLNEIFLKEWIKCFFDCEAHVNESRNQIQIKSVNGKGLRQIHDILTKFNIACGFYGPYNNGLGHNSYYMITIYRFAEVIKYRQSIGFYHSKKQKLLQSL